MNRIYHLYDKLLQTLCEFEGQYPNFASNESELRYVDMLAHTAKNVGKVIQQEMEMEQETEGYANRNSYNNSFAGGMSNRGSYYGGGASYRRNSMGRFSRSGGYSRSGDFGEELRRLMDKAPNEDARQRIQRMIEETGA